MPRKRNVSGFLEKTIDFVPRTVVRLMPQRYRSLVARKLNQPNQFCWKASQVPSQPQDFEDLAFLFWSSPLNRGVARLDFDEAAALWKIARASKGGTGMEVGRFNGGSSFLVAVAMGVGSRFLSIDLMPQNDDVLRKMLDKAALTERVELVVADANAYNTDETFDFCFIDGDHSYNGAAKDHNKWGAKTRVGGFILHHDMSVARPLSTSRRALEQLRDDILRVQKHDIELVQEVGSLTIFRRKAASWTPIPLQSS